MAIEPNVAFTVSIPYKMWRLCNEIGRERGEDSNSSCVRLCIQLAHAYNTMLKIQAKDRITQEVEDETAKRVKEIYKRKRLKEMEK